MSWTCGCQRSSSRCSQSVTHCRKEICCTCLLKESIPAIPFWNSKHPTYQKLEVPVSRSTFRHLCIKWWHHAHPFVAAAEKTCHMQRSRRSGHGVVVQRIVTIYWLCCQLCYETAANQRTIVEIELLATVSWTCGCQPFSCRCSPNVTHCRKEICSTCLFRESMPFVTSKHPIHTRSLSFPRAAYVPPSLHQMVASCPSLPCSCRKNLSYAEKQRVWICYNTVIVL